MLITSSILMLFFAFIKKNKLANTFSQTMLKKHDQSLLLQSAVALATSVISNGEKTKNEEKEKKDSSVNTTEKTDEKEHQKKKELEYFKLYWQKCNKWLEFPLTQEKHQTEGNIKIYIMAEDGKLPLKRILTEYNSFIKSKGTENEKNKTDDKSENKNQNEYEQKVSSQEKTSKDKDASKRDLKEKENELTKNIFFKTIQDKFFPLEEKNEILKKAHAHKKENGEQNKESFFQKCIKFHMKNEREEFVPLSLIDALPREKELEELIFDKANETGKGLQKIYSVNNEEASLLYLAPETLELLAGKQITLNDEARKAISEKGIELFKQQQLSPEKTWDMLFEKSLGVKYPKELLENNEIKKIFSLKKNIPEVFSALIKINTFSGTLLALVTFKKSTESTKEMCEYFVKSVYIIPNT